MKWLIWLGFGVLALLWTTGAALAAALLDWTAGALASGQAAEIGRTAAKWPVPAWASLWIDPEWVRALQEALVWTLDVLGDVIPMLGTMLGWLVPLVWVGWGLGMLTMSALLYRLVRRKAPRPAPA